jgi:hypothetical protein
MENHHQLGGREKMERVREGAGLQPAAGAFPNGDISRCQHMRQLQRSHHLHLLPHLLLLGALHLLHCQLHGSDEVPGEKIPPLPFSRAPCSVIISSTVRIGTMGDENGG